MYKRPLIFDYLKVQGGYAEIETTSIDDIWEAYCNCAYQIESKYQIPPEDYSKIEWCLLSPDMHFEKYGEVGIVAWKIAI